MRLVVSSSAAKVLRRVQPKLRARIEAALERLAADPFGAQPNARFLAGTKGGFRLRIGDWRVLYRVERGAGVVFVDDIGPRGGIYR